MKDGITPDYDEDDTDDIDDIEGLDIGVDEYYRYGANDEDDEDEPYDDQKFIDEELSEWREGYDWEEIPLRDALEGDYVEYEDRWPKGSYNVGILSAAEDGSLEVRKAEVIEGDALFEVENVITADRKMDVTCRSVHVWRRNEPDRLDEPDKPGYYVTRSGILLLREDGKWSAKANTDATLENADWGTVTGTFDATEFPLIPLKEDWLKIVWRNRDRML